MNAPLLARYRERMAGVLTGCELIVITGTRPGVCHAAGMTSFLNAHHICIFDNPRIAEPFREYHRRRLPYHRTNYRPSARCMTNLLRICHE